ncbi:uncharacterized protein FMAN_09410 [Fusarium mangiferae]|uniref:Protein kinase domain-containing protein n=1 Tax=Fusarium mangiferae TaxID=192010 RepID=A0A1L7T7N6_FUSMA|nr:uncharacterized protein FMAN_09410 [Fusarium mangiferae]CVK91267.1 uncharacterized protein FMAN_09410 [Fusarium mangiferae]
MDNPAEGPREYPSPYFPPSCPRPLTSMTTTAGYDVGDVLELQILQSNNDLLPQHEKVSVEITAFITCTMATVVRVKFDKGCAVLKLYDRRFGNGLRDCGYQNIPYDDQAKAAFHGFLKRGAMEPFLKEMDDEDSTTNMMPRTACQIRDEPDGVARFEALLWTYTFKHFKTETEAYTRMQDLQGVLIPKFYAAVRLTTGVENTGEHSYFDILGILLESIDGYSLDEFIFEPCAPKTKREWLYIVQDAVDSVHEINKRGIILDDSAPRNVVVEQASHQVFIIDFAQCFFKDTMFNTWEWDTDAED